MSRILRALPKVWPIAAIACAVFSARRGSAAIAIDAIPGAGAHVSGYPAFDNDGRVVFTDGSALYAWQNHVLITLAGVGDPVPGSAGQTFATIDRIDVEQQGPVAFRAQLSGGTSAFFVQQITGITYAAGPAIPAPGLPGYIITVPSTLATFPTGQYAFFDLAASGANTTTGIWANLNGSLQAVAINGTQVPGMALGIKWNNSYTPPVILADNKAAFFGVLSNGQTGIFAADGTTATALALSNQPVPGQAGKTFGNIPNNQLWPNHSGDFAIFDSSIWRHTAAGFQQIAKVGSPIIGGGTLALVFSAPQIADSGRVTFTGFEPGSVSGIYYSDGAGINVIARTGMRPPDAGPTITFKTVHQPDTNASGQVAFVADLFDSSTGFTLFNYLYATLPDGTLTFITKGVNTADFLLYSREFTDVRLTQFSDTGDLVYTSQGAAFVAHVVPEPSTALCLFAGVVSLAWIRKRK